MRGSVQWTYKDALDISGPGMYSPEELDALEAQFLFPSSMTIVTSAITTRVGNKTGIGMDFSTMLSPETHAIPELIV